MTVVLSLQQDLIYQDVETPSSSPWSDLVDLTIPAGKQVVGSGVLITHTFDGVTQSWILVDSSNFPVSDADLLRVFDGPHPTDSTKWRVTLSMANHNGRIRARAWVALIGQ